MQHKFHAKAIYATAILATRRGVHTSSRNSLTSDKRYCGLQSELWLNGLQQENVYQLICSLETSRHNSAVTEGLTVSAMITLQFECWFPIKGAILQSFRVLNLAV